MVANENQTNVPYYNFWNISKINGSDFKTIYKTRVNTTVKSWHKVRQTGHGNRIWSPELNPHVYSQHFTTSALIQWEKRWSFQ